MQEEEEKNFWPRAIAAKRCLPRDAYSDAFPILKGSTLKDRVIVLEEASWLSQQLLTAIFAILVREVIGYEAVYLNPTHSTQGVFARAAAGGRPFGRFTTEARRHREPSCKVRGPEAKREAAAKAAEGVDGPIFHNHGDSAVRDVSVEYVNVEVWPGTKGEELELCSATRRRWTITQLRRLRARPAR